MFVLTVLFRRILLKNNFRIAVFINFYRNYCLNPKLAPIFGSKLMQIRFCCGSALPVKFYENYDANTLKRHFEILEKSPDNLAISLDHLLAIPKKVNDSNLTKAQYFVEKIAKNWLKSLEVRLNGMKFNREMDLFGTLYCLSSINTSSKGDLVKSLGGLPSLETFLRICLQGSAKSYFTSERFSVLFKVMDQFQSLSNEQYSTEILNCAREALRFVQHKPDFEIYVGTIISRFHHLRIQPPSEEWMKDVIILCYSLLKSYDKFNVKQKNREKNLDLLNNIGRIALAFYDLNIDPNRYESNFWTKFFRIFRSNFISFENKERFSIVSLKFVLLLTLKFDLENIFIESMHQFWSSNIANVQFYLKIAERKEILNACVSKYEGDLEKIERILTAQVLNEFLQTLGDKEYSVKTDFIGKRRLVLTDRSSVSGDDSSLPYQSTYDRSMAGKNRLDNYMDNRTYELLLRELRSKNLHNRNAFDKSPRVLSSVLRYVTGLSILDQKEFVENYFPILWPLLEPWLFKSNSYVVAHLFQSLTTLNDSSRGLLKRCLDPNRLEQLFVYVLRQTGYQEFTCNHMTELFGSIHALLIQNSTNPVSSNIRREIANSVERFFDAKNFNNKKFSNFYPRRISFLLENFYTCRLDAPSKGSLTTMVQCCSELFDSDQCLTGDNIDKMKLTLTAMRLARLFVFWKIDLDEYRSEFWKFYYNEIRLRLIEMSFKYNNVTSELIKTAFASVLLFNKEKEFEPVKYVFWSTIRNMKNIDFKRDLAESIFSVAKATGKIDNSLKSLITNDILDDLNAVLNDDYKPSQKLHL